MLSKQPLSISHISDDFATVTPIQMHSPVIPNLRMMQDHVQWHAILDMLQSGETDILIPKYIIEHFETVYQRRLIVPNDCVHIQVDSNRKYMQVPATCYHDMALMYSEESVCWYTFIQSVKQPDHVAVIRVWIRGSEYHITPIEETCCGIGYNILDGWDIEFPFLHRYIQHYNKAMVNDSGHSAGQISKFNNMMATPRTLSQSYSIGPDLDSDIIDLQDKIMKQAMEEYAKNYTLKIKPLNAYDADWI